MRDYKTVAYIVDNSALPDATANLAYQAEPIPADPTKSMVYVRWDDENMEERFEATPGVLWLGFPWDVPPAEAIPLIQSMYQTNTDLLSSVNAALPVTNAPPEILATMLRRTSQLGRRIA